MMTASLIQFVGHDGQEINRTLANLDAGDRVGWALTRLPGPQVLSSSFGVQSAVMLHLLTVRQPDIPVVLVDTGYLFPETYDFIDALTERLDLNLHIVRPLLSPAWLERRYGRLWEQGAEALARYNRLAKVEPMQRKLNELGVQTWFSGLRRSQSRSRENTPFADFHNGRWKVHPLADWSDDDVAAYLRRHDLPYHPLRDQGYVSIGDTHTTRPLQAGMAAEDTRFFGIKRECGLHTEV